MVITEHSVTLGWCELLPGFTLKMRNRWIWRGVINLATSCVIVTKWGNTGECGGPWCSFKNKTEWTKELHVFFQMMPKGKATYLTARMQRPLMSMVNVVQEGSPGPKSSGQPHSCTGDALQSLTCSDYSETTETGLSCSWHHQLNEISSSISVTYLSCPLAPGKGRMLHFWVEVSPFQALKPGIFLGTRDSAVLNLNFSGWSKTLFPPMSLQSKSCHSGSFFWRLRGASPYIMNTVQSTLKHFRCGICF